MTEENARRIANLMIAGAVLGAGYYIVRTPQLRRVAWRLLVTALTGTVPAWLGGEVRHAWAEAGERRPHDMMGG